MAIAQNEFYNKGASITIQQGALVHIQGELVNHGASSGDIKNDGVIEVKGDFENQSGASFTTNSAGNTDRAVRFVGPQTGNTQYIKGDLSSGAASFYNLVVDLNSPSALVAMQSDAKVDGSLIFGSGVNTTTYSTSLTVSTNNQRGIVNTDNYLLDITNSNLDAIKGYDALGMNNSTTTGFVMSNGSKSNNGGLQRAVTATSYEYPIGTYMHQYNPVRINFVSVQNGGSVKGKFNDVTGSFGNLNSYESHYPSTPTPPSPPDNTGFNYWFPSNPCNGGAGQWVILENAVQNHGYWSFQGTGINTAYNYSIEVFPTNYTDLGVATDLSRAIKHSGTAYNGDASVVDWSPEIESSVTHPNDLLIYSLNGGCYAGAGVPGGRYNGFSHFGVAKAKTGGSLPVELLYVKAEAVNNNFIQVSWSTSLEINNSGFDVFRSEDGIHWTRVGWVNGHNNSTVTQTYSFDDHTVLPNIVYYYQLKQIDNDGQSELSPVVFAIIHNEETLLVSELMPNPAKDAAKLIITTAISTPLSLEVVDVLGRVVISQNKILDAGDNTITLDLRSLPNASYTAIIQASGRHLSKRLVVTN